MKFLDSNIIAYAFYENEFQKACQQALRDGGIINTVTLIEAIHVIELQTERETAIRAVKGIMKANIEIIDVDTNLLFQTMKRAEKYTKLKFIDLLHYTTALLSDCESILSYDADFDGLEIPRERA